MTALEFIEKVKGFNNRVDSASKELNNLVKNNRSNFGLVADSIKTTLEYKLAKKEYQNAFNELRIFNKSVSNKIKSEANKINRGY